MDGFNDEDIETEQEESSLSIYSENSSYNEMLNSSSNNTRSNNNRSILKKFNQSEKRQKRAHSRASNTHETRRKSFCKTSNRSKYKAKPSVASKSRNAKQSKNLLRQSFDNNRESDDGSDSDSVVRKAKDLLKRYSAKKNINENSLSIHKKGILRNSYSNMQLNKCDHHPRDECEGGSQERLYYSNNSNDIQDNTGTWHNGNEYNPDEVMPERVANENKTQIYATQNCPKHGHAYINKSQDENIDRLKFAKHNIDENKVFIIIIQL